MLQHLISCFLTSVRKEEEAERQATAAVGGAHGPHNRKTRRAIKRSLPGSHTPAGIPPFDTTYLHKTILYLLKGVRLEPSDVSATKTARSPVQLAEHLCKSVARTRIETTMEVEADESTQMDL